VTLTVKPEAVKTGASKVGTIPAVVTVNKTAAEAELAA
jgi:hypothetical protein